MSTTYIYQLINVDYETCTIMDYVDGAGGGVDMDMDMGVGESLAECCNCHNVRPSQ